VRRCEEASACSVKESAEAPSRDGGEGAKRERRPTIPTYVDSPGRSGLRLILGDNRCTMRTRATKGSLWPRTTELRRPGRSPCTQQCQYATDAAPINTGRVLRVMVFLGYGRGQGCKEKKVDHPYRLLKVPRRRCTRTLWRTLGAP
jgi:hypothetical protein